MLTHIDPHRANHSSLTYSIYKRTDNRIRKNSANKVLLLVAARITLKLADKLAEFCPWVDWFPEEWAGRWVDLFCKTESPSSYKGHVRGNSNRPGSNSELSFHRSRQRNDPSFWQWHSHTLGDFPRRGDETNVKYSSTKDREHFLTAWRYRFNNLARVKRKRGSFNAAGGMERWGRCVMRSQFQLVAAAHTDAQERDEAAVRR